MCAWETHQGCPAPIKSSVFRTEGSENLHSGRIFRPLCTFPLSTERYTPALPVQRPKLSTFMELPAYRVVIMPYGVHERLRSHRGVDLTGKPRDSAFAYHHYRTNWKGCQGAMSPSRPACGRGLGGQKGDGQSPSPQRVKKVFSPPRGAGIHRRPSRFPCALRPEIGDFLETGSLSPPLAAHRPFPLLGFPAHTHPYHCGEFTTLSTVSGRKYTPSAQLGSEPAADFTPAGSTRRSRC